MPAAFGIRALDQVEHQRHDQQHRADLRARHQGTDGHDQVQHVADRPQRGEGLQPFGFAAIRVLAHCSPPSRASALRSAFSSMPLVPSRRSSSAITSAGFRP